MRWTGYILFLAMVVFTGASGKAVAQSFDLEGVLNNLGKEILSPDLDDGPAPSGQGSGSGGTWSDPDAQSQGQSPSVAGPGYSRAHIAEAQRLLAEQGYDPGVVDGVMGRKTRDAIRQFQSARGAPATGRPDNATLTLLREASAGQTGSAALIPNASFGCAVAKTASERAICNSIDLARLDRAVAMAFRNGRDNARSAQDRDRITRDQRDWLVNRESCGGDVECIDLQMSLRIAELGGDQIALVSALRRADETNTLVASGSALSGDAAQFDDDGEIYEFLLDRYIAIYPDITASDDFVTLYAARHCADPNDRAALERASVNEFDRRDFMQRWRERVPQIVSQAKSRPAIGRFEREFTLNLPRYDFDRRRFLLTSNQRSTGIALYDQQRCRSGLASEISARPYPTSFQVVSTSGGGLGAAEILEMIGGSLPMNPTEARSHLDRYGRELRIKATYEVGAPERPSPKNDQGAVTGKVVAVILEAKEIGAREWRPVFRYPDDQIVNPSKIEQPADGLSELNYDDLLSRYLRAFPETVADKRTASGWAYRDEAGRCSTEFSTAESQDEFKFEEMLQAAPGLAAAAIATMPEPPHRFVLRRNVQLGRYDFAAGAFPLSGGLRASDDNASAARTVSASIGGGAYCTEYLDGRFPRDFRLAVRNADPTFALGFSSSDEASAFLREKGLTAERSLMLEYVLEVGSLELARDRRSLGEARVVSARLLDSGGAREILRFDDQAFVKANETADEVAQSNRTLTFGDLLIAYVGAHPELVENDDVVWTHLGIDGCGWDKDVVHNEIWEREMLATAREALRREAEATPKGSLGLFRQAVRARFGFYEFEKSLFPVLGDNDGATSIRFEVRRKNRCELPRGTTAPEKFVVEVRNLGPALSQGLPMDAAKGKRFLVEYGAPRMRWVWLDLALEVAAPRMEPTSDGSQVVAAAVATKAHALTNQKGQLLFEYTGLD